MLNDPVIEAASLSSSSCIVLLDTRSQQAFDQHHADGAVRVPIERWVQAAQRAESGLENTAYWEDEINALGVAEETLAIVFDDGRMIDAARVFLLLQHFGANAVIVNGGWPAIADLPLPVSAEKAGSRFVARPGSGKIGLKDRHTLKSELEKVRIFDARTDAEFRGEDLKNNLRGGHLPGALHLPHFSLMENNRLRPPRELRNMLEQKGFGEHDAIVTHCDAGGRAALAAVAALRAGYADVHAYYLSFADWARDESCPIVQAQKS